MPLKKDSKIQYVSENEEKVCLPVHLPEDIGLHEMWQEYAGRCIGCGRCNFVCPTCTCFTMQDIFYRDNENAGERGRVWASCQVDGYSDIAGGSDFPQGPGRADALQSAAQGSTTIKPLWLSYVRGLRTLRECLSGIYLLYPLPAQTLRDRRTKK